MKVLLKDANPVIAEVRSTAPYSVAATPGSGCTVAVEVSLGDLTVWYPWDAGPVTVPTIRAIRGPIRHVRFTRTAGTVATSFGEIL